MVANARTGSEREDDDFPALHGNGFNVGCADEFAGWLSWQLRLKARSFGRWAVHLHIGSSV